MKRLCFTALILFAMLYTHAQQDSTTFRGYLYNDEYKVFLKINFYKKNVKVPGQDIYGDLPGYFGARRDNRLWLITDADMTDGQTAELSIINDFGSEDLTATLRKDKEDNYILTQKSGSRIKIVVNRKWLKLPKEMKFLKR